MSFSREDIDTGKVDIDLSGKQIPLSTPGDVLKTDFLDPLGVSAYRLAKDIKVPANRIGEILAGERSITADTALRLARYFGMSDAFWMSLQADYDLRVAKNKHGADIARDVCQHNFA